MARKSPEREVAELAEALRRHQHEYYVLGRPSATDSEYDALFDRLLELERGHPELVAPDSPSQRVGSDLTNELPEVAHSIPVLSLDKAYVAADVGAWMTKTAQAAGRDLTFVFEEKIDGAAVVLYYERGVLTRAVTRGNGYVGNDVTANVRTIKAVPLRLTRGADVVVRGEIFLPRPEFEQINAQAEVPYANPRNMAAGALRRVKSSEVAKIPLDMLAYEGFTAPQPPTHLRVLEELEELGFRLDPRIGFFAGESDETLLPEVSRRHPSWLVGSLGEYGSYLERERADRASLPYDIDGVVVKVSEMDARGELGTTGHHPKWALAFKFDAPEGVTRVLAIDVQVGRTGRVTPVARVEPVRISGSTVSNVTLHNQEYVDLLDLAVGDTVAVSKRGDVIPAIERVLDKNWDPAGASNRTWRMPPSCPSCGTALVKLGAHTFCPNERDCPDQVHGRLAFFVARGQMDIENLGPETIDVLLAQGLVRDVSDIYTLDTEALLGLPGFGPKKVAAIRAGIASSLGRPYRVVLPSLGIPELGQKVAELLIDAGYRSIDDILRVVDAGDPAPLLSIHGIGEKTAERVLRELGKPEVRERIERLRKAGLNFAEEPAAGAGTEGEAKPAPSGPFAGMVWCVTGTFERWKPRDLAMEEVRKRGGRVSSSVSSQTTHLLAGEGSGSKLEKARRLGIVVVDEPTFDAMLSPSPGK